MSRIAISPLRASVDVPVERSNAAAWPGFVVQTTMRRPDYKFDYSGVANEHYLALHDIVRADGETEVTGLPVSRLNDLRGKLTFVPRGCGVTGWSAGGSEHHRVTMIFLDATSMPAERPNVFGSADLEPKLYFEDEALRYALETLGKITQRDDEVLDLYAESVAQFLSARLHDLFGQREADFAPDTIPDTRFAAVVDYLRTNLSRKVAIDEVAAVAGLSRFHFIKAFGKAVGQSPYQFLLRLRLEEAKRLLSSPSLSVDDVGWMVGFSSSAQFVRMFKSFVGITPGAYRR